MEDRQQEGFSPVQLEQLQSIIQQVIQSDAVVDRLRGPPGPAGPPRLADISWEVADMGYFNPDLRDTKGHQELNGGTNYTNVELFLDRMRDIAALKSHDVVRSNIYFCLKGSALDWYTYELTRDAKDLLQLRSLEEGWFRSLAQRFKTRRLEVLRQLETTTYSWQDVRAGRKPRDYAQTMLRLLKSSGTTSTYDQVLRIVDNLDASMARDISVVAGDICLDEFMTSLDFHYENWKRRANRVNRVNRVNQRRTSDARRQNTNPTPNPRRDNQPQRAIDTNYDQTYAHYDHPSMPLQLDEPQQGYPQPRGDLLPHWTSPLG